MEQPSESKTNEPTSQQVEKMVDAYVDPAEGQQSPAFAGLKAENKHLTEEALRELFFVLRKGDL